MLYEFKKLYSNKAIAIIALFITVVSVIVPIVFMLDFESRLPKYLQNALHPKPKTA